MSTEPNPVQFETRGFFSTPYAKTIGFILI